MIHYIFNKYKLYTFFPFDYVLCRAVSFVPLPSPHEICGLYQTGYIQDSMLDVNEAVLVSSEERGVTFFVSSQIFLRPKRSDAVVEPANELLNSSVNHHEVIHHAPVGGG